MPVAGGGGDAGDDGAAARVTAGNPPTAVQMLGFDITDWAKQGVARRPRRRSPTKEGWDKVIPTALQKFSKYDGKWIAAPVNVHSTNWIWVNKAVLDKVGGKAPKTWDELIALLDKVKAAGVIPLAHGGQAWQDATIFDAVVLSTGGTDFYKKAFIDLDPRRSASRHDEEGLRHAWPSCAAMSTPTSPAATGTSPPPWSSRARPACRSWATGPRANSSRPARSRARTSSASASPARRAP